jgi:hypothetical protein
MVTGEIQPSTKWIKAMEIIQKESTKNFLVFTEWVEERNNFFKYLEKCLKNDGSGYHFLTLFRAKVPKHRAFQNDKH